MDRDARRRGERALAVANGAVAALVVVLSVGAAVPTASWRFAVLIAQATAHVALLATLAFLVSRLVLWPLGARTRAAGLAVTFATAQLLLVADGLVFRMWRFHVNGLVVWVLSSSAGRATLGLTAFDAVVVIAVAALVIGLELAALHELTRWLAARAPGSWPRFDRRLVATVLLAASAEKVVYGFCDFEGVPSVTATGDLLPAYPKVTARRFLSSRFGSAAAAPATVLAAPASHAAQIPQLSIDPDAAAPDVLIIAIDSLRFDAFDEKTMPNLWRLAQSSVSFRNHLSGGNNTRDGIFSLLYGLNAYYWQSALAGSVRPVLLDALDKAGYETHVWSSAPVDFPEFNDTAYRGATSVMAATATASSNARDAEIVDAYARSLRDQPRRPRFDFVFLDSPHNPYSYPKTAEVFTPSVDDYFKASIFLRADVERIHNRYRNAVHFADEQVGRLLAAATVDAGPPPRGRLVVVTGDHGEEFYDDGFWGHFSAFTDAQIHVPLVVSGLAMPPGVVDAPTAHIDVVPTILRAAGVRNAPADLSQGRPLEEADEPRSRLACGWDKCAVVLPDGRRVVVGLTLYNAAVAEIVGPRYEAPQPIPEAELMAILKAALDERARFF